MVAAVAVQKVNNRAIGIDLEVNPHHSVDSFARVCTQEEWSEIQSIEHPVARKSAFLRRWCAKEAYVKALGEGLGYGFKHLEVQRSREQVTEDNNGHSHPEQWILTDKKQKSHPTHPIYTWEMDSATQDGAICISLAYAILSTSSSPSQDPKSPVLEFLINDGEGLPDFK
jgi:phosphopantetheine--protein transferase-like protein